MDARVSSRRDQVFVILYARIVAEPEERKAERLHRDRGRAAADPA